jgi:hypothetical protein
MSDVRMESAVWLFGLLLFGAAALSPQGLTRFLGRGRVSPSPGLLMFLRVAAAFCFFGTIYRLFLLYRR